jgi:hypothetical protein
MRITGRELRKVIRETLVQEMHGREEALFGIYGEPPPELTPEEMAAIYGEPEIDIMGYETGPDDVPWGAADTALAIGQKSRQDARRAKMIAAMRQGRRMPRYVR